MDLAQHDTSADYFLVVAKHRMPSMIDTLLLAMRWLGVKTGYSFVKQRPYRSLPTCFSSTRQGKFQGSIYIYPSVGGYVETFLWVKALWGGSVAVVNRNAGLN